MFEKFYDLISFENPIYLSLGTLISEDLSFFYGLFHLKNHQITALSFILFYTVGIIIGDMMLYYLGVVSKKFSHNKLGQLVSRLYKNKKYDNEFGRFEELLVLTRFIPGSRIPTYMYCGITNYSLLKFISILAFPTFLYALLASSLILISDHLNIMNLGPWSKLFIVCSISFISIVFFRLIVSIRKSYIKYGEILRPFKIFVLRKTKLEFWSPFFIYLPFSCYFVYLLVRYRGISSILNSNPSIKMSGLIGELKSDIDILLKKYTPKQHLEIYTDQDYYPMIVKPDSGMRGIDVDLVHSEDELNDYIKRKSKNIVKQKFCDFENEWGVFYYRLPNEKKGKILSVTVKDFPTVVGDGINSLYELVLKNKDYRNRFNWILLDHNPRYVPNKGETVKLVMRGSHSKGCIFRDGEKFLSEPWMSNICEVFDEIPEFYIGRFDIKFENLMELKKGNFKIIELNGSGGESSNFYDPNISKIKAYSIIKKQWDLIFKIGSLNSKTGNTILNFFKAIYCYKRQRHEKNPC